MVEIIQPLTCGTSRACLRAASREISPPKAIVPSGSKRTTASTSKLHERKAESAVVLAEEGSVKTAGTYFDGTYEVPYIGLEPIAVTESNMQVIIDDGYHLEEDIYLNVER